MASFLAPHTGAVSSMRLEQNAGRKMQSDIQLRNTQTRTGEMELCFLNIPFGLAPARAGRADNHQ